MVWVWVVVIVIVVGAAVVIAVGRDDAMADVYDDRPDTTVPSGRALTSDDVDAVRFTTAVRGYRMDEVDAFVARVTADLLARESRELEATAAHAAGAEGAAPDDPDPDPGPGTAGPEQPGRHLGDGT
jgi:DivIVA domain-containing protein